MSRSDIIAAIAASIALVSAAAAWKSEATARSALEVQRLVAVAQMITTLSPQDKDVARATMKRLCHGAPTVEVDAVSFAIYQMPCAEMVKK